VFLYPTNNTFKNTINECSSRLRRDRYVALRVEPFKNVKVSTLRAAIAFVLFIKR